MTRDSAINRERLDQLRAIQRPGAPSLLERVVGIFHQESEELISNLRDALDRQAGEEVRQLAHRFKSVCGNVGAEQLSDRCRDLELKGKAGQLADAGRDLLDIAEERERVVEALAREISGTPVSG